MTITVTPDLDTLPELKVSHGGDEPDGFSHYVEKAKLTDAMVFGTPVRALCGRLWVPSRDSSRFPVCPTCKNIYDGLPGGESDDSSR